MCAKAFSPEPRGDCRMVKHSTLPLSQQPDPCRRLWAWKGCQPATLHPRQKMQSMQGIQPSERGLLLSPTALCPQTLRVLVLFVPSTILRRYFQGGDNFSPHRDHKHHPGRPSLNDSPLNRPGVGGEQQRKSWEQFAMAPWHGAGTASAVLRLWGHMAAQDCFCSAQEPAPTSPKQHLKLHLKSWNVHSLCIHLQEVFLPSLALPTVCGLHSPMPLIHKINRIQPIK